MKQVIHGGNVVSCTWWKAKCSGTSLKLKVQLQQIRRSSSCIHVAMKSEGAEIHKSVKGPAAFNPVNSVLAWK